jgi:8-oxo-dGTP pyrophosphatase MutT (NUDIX family)
MIGSKECLSVGLSVLVVDEKEEILLEKRTDNGLYCLPGGSIDLGETVMEGAKREVKEETGLALGDITLFMILSGEKMKLSYPNGDVTDYVDLVFYSQVDSRKITMGKHDRESSEIYFCPLSRLPEKKEFLRGSYEVIQKYVRKDFTVTVD